MRLDVLSKKKKQVRASGSVARPYIVPLKWVEHGVYGDLILTYPKPYSIYLRGTILDKPQTLNIFYLLKGDFRFGLQGSGLRLEGKRAGRFC